MRSSSSTSAPVKPTSCGMVSYRTSAHFRSCSSGHATTADHIAAVCRSGFFQLRQLRSIRQSLTPDPVKTLVHAFISSRLDHCNQLFVGVTGRLLDKLQSLQNAAARLVTGARKFSGYQSSKGSGLRQPFWFLVFKCLHGLAPEYLSKYCKLTTGRSHLRSANACLLSVPRTRKTYGDRSFAVSGPVAWNSLPVALRSSDVMEETFRRHLKTFLFNCLDN